MSRCGFYPKYVFYKERCRKLSLENKRLQTIIDSCRILLNASVEQNKPSQSFVSPVKASSPFLTPVKASSPSSSPTPKKELSFQSASCKYSSDEISFGEPGENKWECLSDEEIRKLSTNSPKECETMPSPSTASQPTTPLDLDATFFESGTSEENKNADSFGIKNTSPKRSKLENMKNNVASKPTPKRQKSPIGHACRSSKGPDYVFYASKRELAKFSPRTRRMGTSKRAPYPAGYFSLDMPSTQDIRSRNQTQSPS